MKKSHFYILINSILLLLGIIFILLSGYEFNYIITNLLRALGIGLVTASLVNSLMKQLEEKTIEEIVLTNTKRIKHEKIYTEMRDKSEIVEVMSIALTGALDDYIQNKHLIEKIFTERHEVRLLFLNPSSPYVKQRAVEDGETEQELINKLIDSIDKSRTICKLLDDAYMKKNNFQKDKIGSFEIRLFDDCPYFTVFRADDTILWGLYTNYAPGSETSVLEVKKSSSLFSQLKTHFDTAWKANSGNYIVRLHRGDKPSLNEALLKTLPPRQIINTP